MLFHNSTQHNDSTITWRATATAASIFASIWIHRKVVHRHRRLHIRHRREVLQVLVLEVQVLKVLVVLILTWEGQVDLVLVDCHPPLRLLEGLLPWSVPLWES
jgi:hypothetical protein